MLVDTHCHLDFPEFKNDREAAISRAESAGIYKIINIGSSLEGSKKSVELAQKHKQVYACVGIHPHDADKVGDDIAKEIGALAKEKKVVGIGEVGLDYYKNYSRADNQKKVFRMLAQLARNRSLPLVIHNRSADKDTLEILSAFLPLRVVLHCFSGSKDFLQHCLGQGFFVSFTCNITYRKADNLRELVRLCPLEKMMLETDAPFLPPEGMRGKRNEPAYIRELAVFISSLKGVTFEEVCKVTTQTAQHFFNL